MGDVTKLRPRGRGVGRPFRKGQSGNPSGRAKTPPEFLAQARASAPEALQVAITLMRDEAADPKLRLQAAALVLDRAYGKAPQQIESEVNLNAEVRSVTVAELMAMADR